MLKKIIKIDLPFLAMITLANFIAYFSLVACGRILGPVEYGKVAALLGLYYILVIPGSIIQMNFARLASHAKDNLVQIRNLVASGFAKFMPLSLTIMVALILLAPFLSRLLKINSVVSFSLLAVTLSAFYLLSILSGVIQGMHKFNSLGLLNILLAVLKAGVAISLVAFGFGAPAVMAGYLVGTLSAIVFTLGVLKIKNPFDGVRQIKVFDRASLAIFLTMVGMVIINESSILFVKAFLDYEEAGNYALLVFLGNAIVFSVGAILQVMFPSVAAAHKKGQNFLFPAKRTFLLTSTICLIALVSYFCIPVTFWNVIFGTKFQLDHTLLFVYASYAVLFSFGSYFVNLNLAIENRKIWQGVVILAFFQISLFLLFHDNIVQIIVDLLAPTTILTLYLITVTFKKLKHETEKL